MPTRPSPPPRRRGLRREIGRQSHRAPALETFRAIGLPTAGWRRAMHSRHLLVLLILISMFAPGARALSIVENSPYRTVEWFVADSDLIVRGLVRAVAEAQVNPS